jgi:DNA ligase-1
MLADKADLTMQRYPVLAAAKLDGIRAMGIDGGAKSRSMLLLPNLFIQSWFLAHAEALQGLDGELIVGSPTAEDVYRTTDSAVMRIAGEPDFTYYVFDRWDSDLPYHQRVAIMPPVLPDRVRLLEHEMMYSLDDITAFEERMLDLGYEGVILRDPNALYKQGRSTTREGYLLKIKRWEDAEGVIIGYAEEMHNGNEATQSEIGRTKRSSHQANMTGKGTLGAWTVRGLTAFEGIEFNVSGMTAQMRAEGWANRDAYVAEGRIIKYKYFAVGVKNKPRHPKFLGFRNRIDL